jgi:tRNA pseudouridine55 synthase
LIDTGLNCWLNIYKPRYISSAKAVSIVKKHIGSNKIGHCGTLDVEAEGVLPLAIGEATKLVRLLMDARKTYIFTIQFGSQTDSGDASGKIIKTINYDNMSLEQIHQLQNHSQEQNYLYNHQNNSNSIKGGKYKECTEQVRNCPRETKSGTDERMLVESSNADASETLNRIYNAGLGAKITTQSSEATELCEDFNSLSMSKKTAYRLYPPLEDECRNICSSFIGVIEQIPPTFSAIKVCGIRSYKLARANKALQLASRKITIYNLDLISFNQQQYQATYKVTCSKGTYVRTLAEDIALSLQSLGFVVELRRTRVGLFTMEDAINVMDLDLMDSKAALNILETKSLKIEAILADIPVLEATLSQAQKIKYGQECFFDHVNMNVDFIWVRYNDALLAIGRLNNTRFESFRIFNLVKWG